jgi:hypothetical protein
MPAALARYRSGLESAAGGKRGAAGATGAGSSAARGAGDRFQRERDLEGVVDALRRVVDKQVRYAVQCRVHAVPGSKD